MLERHTRAIEHINSGYLLEALVVKFRADFPEDWERLRYLLAGLDEMIAKLKG